jgi:hypothetical protein
MESLQLFRSGFCTSGQQSYFAMQEIGVALVRRDGAATGPQRIVLLNVKYKWLVVSGDDYSKDAALLDFLIAMKFRGSSLLRGLLRLSFFLDDFQSAASTGLG